MVNAICAVNVTPVSGVVFTETKYRLQSQLFISNLRQITISELIGIHQTIETKSQSEDCPVPISILRQLAGRQMIIGLLASCQTSVKYQNNCF